MGNYPETVSLLIKHPKYNVNEKNSDSGETILHWNEKLF
jgi:hypothetical protein